MGDVRRKFSSVRGSSAHLLVVTGTRREGSLVNANTVLAGGGDAARLRAELNRLAPRYAAIISFGTAGALDPSLAIGDVVIGSGLASGESCDAEWIASLQRLLPRAKVGAVFANGRLLASTEDKAEAAQTGALIVDMESHLAAAAAARHGLPLAILRCVSDTAKAPLPPAIAVAMHPDGGLALGALAASLLRHPGQIPALIGTGVGFARAFAALKAAVAATGPQLGFDRRA